MSPTDATLTTSSVRAQHRCAARGCAQQRGIAQTDRLQTLQIVFPTLCCHSIAIVAASNAHDTLLCMGAMATEYMTTAAAGRRLAGSA